MRGLCGSEEFGNVEVGDAGTSCIAPVGISVVVGLLVGYQILVVANPEVEAAVLVELVVEFLAHLRSVIVGFPWNRVVRKAAECFSAKLEEIGVRRFVAVLPLGIEFLLLHGQSEVGRALENGELCNFRSDLLDYLNARGTSANDADTFVLHVNALLRPDRRVGTNALELVEALEGWYVVLRRNAGAKDEILGVIDVTALGLNVPNACGVVPLSGLNESVEAIVQ
jgi:hypothetical protein